VTVRTIRITALLAQMKFDVSQFSVAPKEEVEIVLVNADHMPHNLLITAPGAMESVALKAEAMAAQPDAFQKHFVPDTPEVLHATRLINHEEIARLRFTAPDAEGKYPFVCTFPGHWRTMNGTMEVTEKVPGTRE
jgi:azurin